GALASSPLFPYTTLFRSGRAVGAGLTPRTGRSRGGGRPREGGRPQEGELSWRLTCRHRGHATTRRGSPEGDDFRVGEENGRAPRSEEHTSELQSRENLVC